MILCDVQKPAGWLEWIRPCRFAIFTLIAFSAITVYAQGEVPIGLLIPDAKTTAARQGAELAVRLANRQGGYKGKPFRLVVRSMEGPWGTGSKQAVDLIFTEKAAAIVVSNDGRNAHLAEQAITKTQVPMVSTWSGDPTLSQAFVPWFFTIVPKNLQQGATLVKEIYSTRKCKKPALLVDTDYDSKSAESGFRRMLKETKNPDPLLFTLQTENDIAGMIRQIKASGADAILLFCAPALALKVLRRVKQEQLTVPVFASSFLIDENRLTKAEMNEFTRAVWFALGTWSGPAHDTFVREYVLAYKHKPGLVAAYAFDGVYALLVAIKKAGTDRSNMQQALMNMKFPGVTGPVGFDSKGNRTGSFGLVRLQEGLPETH